MKSQRPPVGIVIVSYNTRELLRACLRSIEQTELPHRIVVVDNASSDGSPAMVAREFPHAVLIANPTNRGFAAATNQGICAVRAEAELVLLLNPDTALQAGALQALVDFMHDHPRVGVCGARLVYPDGGHQAAAFRFPTLLMALFDLFPPRGPLLGRLQGSYLNGRYPEEHYEQPFAIDHPLGAAMLIRGQTLDDVGLFDEAYWMYAEEVDWCFRCRRAGWAIWQVPAARVVHHAGASSSQFRERSFVALHRSRLRFVDQWHTERHRRWYRHIIRLGMLRATLRAWQDYVRGKGGVDELRRRLLAYGTVTRLLDSNGALS